MHDAPSNPRREGAAMPSTWHERRDAQMGLVTACSGTIRVRDGVDDLGEVGSRFKHGALRAAALTSSSASRQGEVLVSKMLQPPHPGSLDGHVSPVRARAGRQPKLAA